MKMAGHAWQGAIVMRMVVLLAGLLGFAAQAADGVALAEISLKGSLQQGGLVVGSVPPGSRVALDGKPVKVTEDGRFVIGFDRDAPATARLAVTTADGGTETRQLTIAARDYDVQRIEGVPQRTVEPPPEALKRIQAEQALVTRARTVDSDRRDFLDGFSWPLTGRISGVYGSQRVYNGVPGRPHYGIDIAAPTGTPVRAPARGVVTLVHPDMYFSGGTLIVDHGHGVSSTFIHLSEVLAEEGAQVEPGDVIARVGASGRATGPHLDWRINWFGKRLDPALLVPPMPAQQARGDAQQGDGQ